MTPTTPAAGNCAYSGRRPIDDGHGLRGRCFCHRHLKIFIEKGRNFSDDDLIILITAIKEKVRAKLFGVFVRRFNETQHESH